MIGRSGKMETGDRMPGWKAEVASNGHGGPGARAAVLLFLLLPGLTFVGCASHSRRVRDARVAYDQGDLDRASELLQAARKSRSGDRDCLVLDQAMVSLVQGNTAEAERQLREVRDRFDFLEQKAVGEQTLALVTDDTAMAYGGEDYEKIMIRAMLALSNLMQDGADAVAYCLQVDQKQREIIAQSQESSPGAPEPVYRHVALGAYLRGILQEESLLHYDDARRAFGEVARWEPEFELARYDLQRVQTGVHSSRGNGVVYLFAMVGRGPIKEESVAEATSAALLIADRILSATGKQTLPPTIAPVKIPEVVVPPCAIDSVAVAVDDRPCGLSQTVTDVGRLAWQQCEANRNRRIAQAVVRRSLKKAAIYSVKEVAGVESPLAGVAYDAAGVLWEATEKADTRGWDLLPAKVQVLRIELPAGIHQLSLRPARNGQPLGPLYQTQVGVVDGRNTYVLATFPGPRLVGKILTSGSGPLRK